MIFCALKIKFGAEDMAVWLGTQAALSEDLGSIASTNVVTHNYLQLQF